MPFGRGPHQSVLALARVGGIDFRAVFQQQLHSGNSPGARGDHQRGFAVPAPRFGIRPRVDQFLHHGEIAGRARQRERRLAILIGGVRVGAGLHQGVHHVGLVEIDGPGERRSPIGLRQVDVGVFGEQRGH